MEVILLENIRNLGKAGETVIVKDGKIVKQEGPVLT